MAKLGRIVISLEQPPGGTWDHQILRGLQPLLQERDYALIMHDASYNDTRAEPVVPFREHDMDALIVDGHAATDDYLRQMRSAGVPIVLLGRTLPDSGIPAVMPDNFGGAHRARFAGQQAGEEPGDDARRADSPQIVRLHLALVHFNDDRPRL